MGRRMFAVPGVLGPARLTTGVGHPGYSNDSHRNQAHPFCFIYAAVFRCGHCFTYHDSGLVARSFDARRWMDTFSRIACCWGLGVGDSVQRQVEEASKARATPGTRVYFLVLGTTRHLHGWGCVWSDFHTHMRYLAGHSRRASSHRAALDAGRAFCYISDIVGPTRVSAGR